MNSIWRSSVLVGTLSSVGLTQAQTHRQEPDAPRKRIEIAITKVFIPPVGFDSNDTVVALVDGSLPSGCYALAETSFDFEALTNTFHLRQYATRDVTGLCAPGQEVPSDVAAAVPFTQEVGLGKLGRGHYRIEYATTNGRHDRPFRVDEAAVTTIDNLRYAAMTSINAPDLVASRNAKTFKLTLSGLLTSTCVELAPVVTERTDDVLVILPTTRLKNSEACLPIVRGFTKEIEVDMPPLGRYLIHVRSLNGRALNRLFSVVDETIDNRF